jgi:uncharacterized protein with FMN-binding domain
VEATSGATISSCAVMNAARKALEQARTAEDVKDDD